jgi:predicted GIY-YIG superfamily endonuclease
MAKVRCLSKPMAFTGWFISNRMSGADEAIAREKQLKRWKRDWKIELIERDNLEWRDLSDLLV